MTWYTLVGLGCVLFVLGWLLGRAWEARAWYELHQRFLDVSRALSSRVDQCRHAEEDRANCGALLAVVRREWIWMRQWAPPGLDASWLDHEKRFEIYRPLCKLAEIGNWRSFRSRARQVFGHFVPADVVDEIVVRGGWDAQHGVVDQVVGTVQPGGNAREMIKALRREAVDEVLLRAEAWLYDSVDEPREGTTEAALYRAVRRLHDLGPAPSEETVQAKPDAPTGGLYGGPAVVATTWTGEVLREGEGVLGVSEDPARKELLREGEG